MKTELAASIIGWSSLRPLKGEPTELLPVRYGPPLKVSRISPKDERLSRWRSHPRLRRTGALTWFLAEAADKAMASVTSVPAEQKAMALAISVGASDILYQFATSLPGLSERPTLPSLFLETAGNAPLSYLGAVQDIQGPASTFLGMESSWYSSLLQSMLWLEEGRATVALAAASFVLDSWFADTTNLSSFVQNNVSLHFGEGAAAMALIPVSEAPKAPRLSIRSTMPAGFLPWPNFQGIQALQVSSAWRTLDAIDLVQTSTERFYVPIPQITLPNSVLTLEMPTPP